MNLETIPVNQFSALPCQIWSGTWFLLTSGDFNKNDFNTMTVAWGSIGTMWNKPFVQVVVRPTRYTFEFMERYDSFTLSAFQPEHRDALMLLGSKSGRDGNKIAEAGLTPCAAALVAAPTFAEANLVIECAKIYWQDMDASHFLTENINNNYPLKDYHRMYFGEILSIRGDESYVQQ